MSSKWSNRSIHMLVGQALQCPLLQNLPMPIVSSRNDVHHADHRDLTCHYSGQHVPLELVLDLIGRELLALSIEIDSVDSWHLQGTITRIVKFGVTQLLPVCAVTWLPAAVGWLEPRSRWTDTSWMKGTSFALRYKRSLGLAQAVEKSCWGLLFPRCA